VDNPGDAAGVVVRAEREVYVASLRYFDAGGAFAGALAAVIGGPTPSLLEAVRYDSRDGSHIVLGWRSPTETVLLCNRADRLAAVEQQAAGRSDGCCVDQSGGIRVWTVAGARSTELLSRLGSVAAIPALGQARTSRLAEVAVTALCVRPGEIILLAERVYSRHLMAWIDATIADF
jgi:sarcosine oxidase gamma subunit